MHNLGHALYHFCMSCIWRVEFEKTANSLEITPQRCLWLSGEYILKNAYRFILFEKFYMIIFQIIDDTVYADYVLDCRQDYGWLIH